MRLVALSFALFLSTTLRADPARYRIDPEHFSIAFMVEHVGYAQVIGQFAEGSGEFVYDEESGQLTSGSVQIGAASVSTHLDKRDQHVRSKDFLNAEKHPLIRFTAQRYRPGKPAGILYGELTMLGQTHPVELEIRLNKAAVYPFGHRKHTLGISATTTLQRSRWGMTYGVANGMVGDEVKLLFEFEALRE